MRATTRPRCPGDSTKITIAIVVAATIAGAAAGAVAGFSLAGGSGSDSSSAERISASVTAPLAVSVAARDDLTPETLYRRDAPSVVVITATRHAGDPADVLHAADEGASRSSRLRLRRRSRGDILTNDHVVHGGTAIRVGFSSGASYPAKVVGADPSTDMAVVRVQAPADALHPLAFDDSGAV